MKLRPPSIPLITVDPMFSVWSGTDRLYDSDTVHWTGKTNTIKGVVTVDGKDYRFMGLGDEPVIEQTGFDYNALSTSYTFGNEKITLKLCFTSPLLPDDLGIMTRPVSYLRITAKSADRKKHDISVKITASEELCLNDAGQSPVVVEEIKIENMSCMRIGNSVQDVLSNPGDRRCTEWGYLYLAVCGEASKAFTEKKDLTYIGVSADLSDDVLVLFAYDDIKSINYFGEFLPSYWNRNEKSITDAMSEALVGYEETYLCCEEFSEGLFNDGVRAGGKKYAEMLELAYRQSIAAHKLAVTSDGEIIFISKECYSGGYTATVDVSYPSVPLFLIYNPELVRGMLRPIYKFAESDSWKYDFAPHDVGMYPCVTGQLYGLNPETGELAFESQMPVEECGNMLIMEAAVLLADGNKEFVSAHTDMLENWVKYLIKYGYDPENQLCTDDFAGHMAHNCNLSLKAVMGIASFSIISKILGNREKANKYMSEARKMAASWCSRAANGDGSYRLAFDAPGSFSMKYNAVWDKIFGTELFPKEVIASELASNFKHINAYGMPLDNRSDYAKSDWLVWTATMLESDDDFEKFVLPLWNMYNSTDARVPMTDLYFSKTAEQNVYTNRENYRIAFQNRTVIGGIFIKTLSYLDKLNIKNIQ